jgi:uncharacterized membrane protein YkvA (DUF1232 family)
MRLLRLWRFKDVRLLLLALRSPNRPWWLWPVALLLVLFALEPANFGLPALGILDDLILLPLLLRAIVKLSGAERLAVPRAGSYE